MVEEEQQVLLAPPLLAKLLPWLMEPSEMCRGSTLMVPEPKQVAEAMVDKLELCRQGGAWPEESRSESADSVDIRGGGEQEVMS